MTLAARSPFEDGPGDRSSSLNFGIGDVLADLGWSRAFPVPSRGRVTAVDRVCSRSGRTTAGGPICSCAGARGSSRCSSVGRSSGRCPRSRWISASKVPGARGCRRLIGLLGDRIVSGTLRGNSSAALDQVAARRLLKWMETRLTVAFWAGGAVRRSAGPVGGVRGRLVVSGAAAERGAAQCGGSARPAGGGPRATDVVPRARSRRSADRLGVRAREVVPARCRVPGGPGRPEACRSERRGVVGGCRKATSRPAREFVRRRSRRSGRRPSPRASCG